MIHARLVPITKPLFEDVRFSCPHCGKYDTYTRRADKMMPVLRNELICNGCGKVLLNMNLIIDYPLVRIKYHSEQN